MATSFATTAEEHEAELRRRLLSPDDQKAEKERVPPPRPLRKRASSMGIVEQLVLSPWEKWASHRRFPYKLALHLVLVLLTLTQMQLYDAQNAAYIRASHRNWAFFFLPPSADIGIVPRFQRELYTINRTLEAVNFLRDAYFSIGNASVANYEYLRTSTGEIQPLQLTVKRVLPHGEPETRRYLVTQDDESVGPFDPTMTLWQQKHLLRSLRAVEFGFPLRDRQYGDFYEECFEWQVRVGFQVVENAQIRVQLEDCGVSRCRSTHQRPFWTAARQRFVWLHVVVAVVSLVYMTLSIKALRRSFHVMARAKRLLKDHINASQNTRQQRLHDITSDGRDSGEEGRTLHQEMDAETFGSRQDIPFSLKLKLFNGLQLLVLVALALLFVSSLWSLFFLKAHVPIHFWHRLLHGTALLLLWSCLVGYLEHNRHIYSIVLTLKWGAPRVLQFLIGVSPIFFGFALFGTIYFGNKIEQFGTLGTSMTTLFAIMNGDVILDTFDALELHHFSVSGKLYLYTFISLFIYVVLNIFIAIVEEAFFATRSTRRRLSELVADPQVSRANVAQETDIMMMRVLLRLLRSE